MKSLNFRVIVTVLAVLGMLLGACAPATTLMTVNNGTPMAGVSGAQVAAQDILANPGCFKNPERVDLADQGLVLWCVKPPQTPLVVLSVAVPIAASDGVSPVMKIVALAYVAGKLIEAIQPQAVTAPDAYLVLWEGLPVAAQVSDTSIEGTTELEDGTPLRVALTCNDAGTGVAMLVDVFVAGQWRQYPSNADLHLSCNPGTQLDASIAGDFITAIEHGGTDWGWIGQHIIRALRALAEALPMP